MRNASEYDAFIIGAGGMSEADLNNNTVDEYFRTIQGAVQGWDI